MTVLEKIINNRAGLLDMEKESMTMKEIRQRAGRLIESGYTPVGFLDRHSSGEPFLIAEIKRSSPSQGTIREDFNIYDIAKAYKSSGHVKAISVLTEPDYFSGAYDYIKKTKDTADRPVLMKDFIIDEYQIYRGFLEGASAVLLIAAILDDSGIEKLAEVALNLNLKVFFETHTAMEYRRALNFNFDLIGINNRDLKTFVTDIHTTKKILDSEGRPENRMIISESGINSREDIRMLRDSGVDGFLIGERFMKEKNIETAIADIFGESHEKTPC